MEQLFETPHADVNWTTSNAAESLQLSMTDWRLGGSRPSTVIPAAFGQLELTAGPEARLIPVQIPDDQTLREAQEALRAMLRDAATGTAWSETSIRGWQRIFSEESNISGRTPEEIFRTLNQIGASINNALRANGINDRTVGIAVQRVEDPQRPGHYSHNFYMLLNIGPDGAATNRTDLAAGRLNPRIIRLGPFVPGQPT